jgi:hypothetical protein
VRDVEEEEMARRFRNAVVLGALGTLVASAAGAITPEQDDILLSHFGGKIQQFRGGVLVDTITSTTDAWVGAVATPDGGFATLYRTPATGLARFDADGGVIAEPTIAGIPVPTDLDVLSDGTFVVADSTQDEVHLVSAAGAVVGTITNATMMSPFGLAVAPGDTIWVVNRGSEDVDHFHRDGTDLGGFALGFEPGEIAIDPADGTLWIADRVSGSIAHRSTAGDDLGSVPTGITTSGGSSFDGLGISSGGLLLVIDRADTQLLGFERNGTPIGESAIPDPDNLFRLTVVPEPSACAGTLAGLGALLGCRERRRVARRSSKQCHRHREADGSRPNDQHPIVRSKRRQLIVRPPLTDSVCPVM